MSKKFCHVDANLIFGPNPVGEAKGKSKGTVDLYKVGYKVLAAAKLNRFLN